MGQSLVLFSSVSLTSVLLLQAEERKGGVGEVLTEEQHPVPHSFLCLFGIKVFLFSTLIMQSSVAAELIGEFSKRRTASASRPLEKNQRQAPVFAQSSVH